MQRRGTPVNPYHALWGVIDLVTAWQQENLLHPAREPGQGWLRQLEVMSKTAATVRVRLAAGRALYAALAHAGATGDAPFTSAKPARDTTAPWDKRTPYTASQVMARVLGHSSIDTARIYVKWDDQRSAAVAKW